MAHHGVPFTCIAWHWKQHDTEQQGGKTPPPPPHPPPHSSKGAQISNAGIHMLDSPAGIISCSPLSHPYARVKENQDLISTHHAVTIAMEISLGLCLGVSSSIPLLTLVMPLDIQSSQGLL